MNTPVLLPPFLTAARHCAMQMMENASYIEKELPTVDALPEELRTRIGAVCRAMIATKHDVFTELFELSGGLSKGQNVAELLPRCETILTWLAEPLGEMNDVVETVQESGHMLAFLLVAESATNILNAFNAAGDALDGLRVGQTGTNS